MLQVITVIIIIVDLRLSPISLWNVEYEAHLTYDEEVLHWAVFIASFIEIVAALQIVY